MIQFEGKKYKTIPALTIINGQRTLYGKKPFCYEIGAAWARATAEGFALPDTLEKTLLNNLIRNDKHSGLFQKMDVYLLFAYNNAELSGFSRINLKNPLGNLVSPYGGMIYTTKGWKGNGTDGYMGTGFNPAIGTNNYSLNNACRASVLYSTGGGAIDGINGTTFNRLFSNNSANHRINSSVAIPASVNMAGTGLKMIGKANATESYLVNREVITTQPQASGSLQNAEQILFKSGASNYSSCCQSAYIMGAALTYTQSQSYRANLNNFLVRLGLSPVA